MTHTYSNFKFLFFNLLQESVFYAILQKLKNMKSKKNSSNLRYKAIKILKSFDENELKNFHTFLQLTPFLNDIGGKLSFGESEERKRHSVGVIQFFELIKTYYPDFSDKLTNPYLMEKMETGISNIKKLFAKLDILCKHFLVLREVATDKYYYDEALLKQFQKRNLQNDFDEKFLQVEKDLNVPKLYQLDDYLMRYKIEKMKFMMNAHEIIVLRKNETQYVIDSGVKSSNHLLFYFIFDSLKLILNLIAHTHTYNVDLNEIEFYTIFRNAFPDNVLKDVVKLATQLAPNNFTKKIIKLYWFTYLFRTVQDEKAGLYFKRYSDLLNRVSTKLSDDEKYDFYTEINFGFLISVKYPKFQKFEFEFYDRFISNEGYKASGKNKMTIIDFRSMMIRGDDTFRFKWTKELLKNHIDKVPEKYHKTIIHFRKATVNFLRYKNYDMALENLRRIKGNVYYIFTCDILILYIKIYYEKKQYDAVLTQLDSLRKFVVYQKLGKDSEALKRFIACTKQLIKNRMEKKDNYIDIIRIVNTDNKIASKKWLIKKIDELQNK